MLHLLLTFCGFLAGWLFGSRRERALETAEPATAPAVSEEHFASLAAQIESLRESTASLRESVGALEKQLARVGREQFKANALGEAQQQQLQTALAQLSELNARREGDLTLWRERLQADQSAERLDVIERLLPALDGLDQALAAGQKLLTRASPAGAEAQAGSPLQRRLTWRQRVDLALGRAEWPTPPQGEAAEWRPVLTAWLQGLELVRERLLEVLASEGVQPIAARGQEFDPYRHIAVEVAPATEGTASGMVVEEYRRGYQVGTRVLRAAEVVVARGESSNA